MASEKSNWVRDRLRELGIEDHEMETARQTGLHIIGKAAAEMRELEEKLADLTRRVEKLERAALEQPR